jgi:tRNA dimethylallyltransferase
MKQTPKVIVVIGPTASGKSDFAIELARKNNGEIISADSRQLYKDLDIGTGKVTHEEMKGVPHHMLDVIDLDQEFSVAQYKKMAQPILEDIISRGKVPIICGGTGQYIDALILNALIPEIPPNKIFRQTLENKTTEELYSDLTEKDSRRAQEIDKHNKVRLIRALEIVDIYGKVPPQAELSLVYETDIYILSPTREVLRERILSRIEKRLQMGMIDEVKKVVEKGYSSDHLKRFGLEYYIIAKYIKEEITEEQMKIELINKINQYAKRQTTWNKKYPKTYKDAVTVVCIK